MSSSINVLGYLEERHGDVHVLRDRPHDHTPVRVLNARLPTVELDDKQDVNKHYMQTLCGVCVCVCECVCVCVCVYACMRMRASVSFTLEHIRLFLLVHTTLNLSGCLGTHVHKQHLGEEVGKRRYNSLNPQPAKH